MVKIHLHNVGTKSVLKTPKKIWLIIIYKKLRSPQTAIG